MNWRLTVTWTHPLVSMKPALPLGGDTCTGSASWWSFPVLTPPHGGAYFRCMFFIPLVTGQRRVRVLMKRGGQAIMEHLKKMIEKSKLTNPEFVHPEEKRWCSICRCHTVICTSLQCHFYVISRLCHWLPAALSACGSKQVGCLCQSLRGWGRWHGLCHLCKSKSMIEMGLNESALIQGSVWSSPEQEARLALDGVPSLMSISKKQLAYICQVSVFLLS